MISSQFLQRMSLRRDTVESFERYPFNLPAVCSLDRLDFHPKSSNSTPSPAWMRRSFSPMVDIRCTSSRTASPF